MDDRLAALEHVAARDVGRSIGPLAAAAAGGLGGAVAGLAADAPPSVAVLTGCFVPRARPPAAETDGPPGAALLCAGLAAMGVPARLVTDPPCAPVVAAAAQATGVALDVAANEEDVGRLAGALRAGGVTHVVAIERLGPGRDGRVRNMRGDDITGDTAPLHRLVSGFASIGIGDGGNEIGMGALPEALVAANVRHGAEIRCAVACDHLVVCGVSNWGALALLLGVGLARGALDAALAHASDTAHDRVLAACVRDGGAVDGVRAVRTETVDGLGAEEHHAVLRALRAAVA